MKETFAVILYCDRWKQLITPALPSNGIFLRIRAQFFYPLTPPKKGCGTANKR